MNRAQGVSETPWQNYGGEFVAPINPQQYTGIGNVNQYAFAAQPTLGVAQNMAWNAAQPISYADIARYQNPWTQNVVGATEAQFNNQNMQQLQNVRGNAIAQGALGGDREAVAEAELANQQNLAQAPVIANLMSQGYTQGVNTALTEQQALASGAYSLGNLGVAGQTAGLTGAGAQIQAGGLEQTTQQAADTAAYNQWLASRAYPFQTTQWLAGLDTGVGSQMGGTSTTQAPTPSPWSQIAGLGLGGLGIMGGTGAFGAGGWFPKMFAASGGRLNGVAGYDDGGGVSPLPYASGRAWEPYAGGRGWVPTAAMTHGQGAPRPPRPPQQDSDPMKLGEQVAGLAKYFKDGKTPTGFPSGGTSPGWLTSDSPITTGYSGVPAGGGVAPSGPALWAASGSPIMSGYSGVAPVMPPPLPPGTGWAGAGSPLMTGYWHGGPVKGYADGGMPSDIDLPYDVRDPGIAPRALTRAVAPGLYDYATAERPPPDIAPNAVGKVPSAIHDPYAEGAVRDVAGLGMAAIPFGRAAGLAARAGEMGSERLGLGAIGDISGSLPTAGLGARTGTAAGIAATLPGGPAEAADAALGPRPGVTLEEQAQVDRLNKEISGLTAQRANATKGMGPKGASVQAQAFDSQIAQRNTSIRTIMDQVAARQQAYDERAEEFAKKTGPFATREPGWNAALTAAPAASAASGAILGGLAGRKISPMKRVATYGAAGLGGGLEGLIGGYYPTYADLHMPEGSVAKTQAEARESDPRFWEHGVAPEIGMSAATGLLGAKYGMLRREAKPVAAAAEAAISPSRYPDLKDVAAVRRYQAGLKQDTAGRWYEPGKGMVSKEYWPPAKPSGKVVPIQAAEAHGGVVRGYWGGGSPFADAPADDLYGGVAPQYVSDPASIRTNNPGAQWMGPVARQFGATTSEGLSGGNNAAVFPDSESGAAAQFALWGHNYTGMPLATAINKWSGGNSPREYTNFIARSMGISPGTVLTPQILAGPQGIALAKAQAQWEAGRPYPMTDAQWTEAQARGMQDVRPTQAAYRNHGVAGGYGDLIPLSPASSQPTGVAPSGIDLSSNSKLWPSLMAAGFGMMASRSPYPLQAVGEGALTGLGAYTKATELESARALKQSDIDLRAQKLWQANESERKKLALDALKAEREYYQPKTIDKYGRIGVPDPEHPGRFLDPVSGQPIQPLNQAGAGASQMAPPGTQSGGMQMISSEVAPIGPQEQAARSLAVQYNPDSVQQGQSKTPPSVQEQDRNWDYLKSLPADRQREIIAIDNGLQVPPSPYTLYGGKSPRAADVNNDLRTFDPGYDYNSFVARRQFLTGPLGNQVRSFNVGIYHLNSLEALARVLKSDNQADVPAVNAVTNFIRTQMGHPEVTNLETARQFIGAEIVKAVVGTRSIGKEREEGRDLFKPGASLDQILGAADTSKEFMAGQLLGFRQQYQAATRLNDFDDKFLVPEARGLLERGRGTGVPGAGAAATAVPAMPSQRPPNVPAGSLRSPSTGQWKGPDGTIYRPDGSVLQKAGQ